MIYTDFDLNSLKIFMAVFESGGIDKASKKLFISQPAVSISIKKLEEKLGGQLFTRLPKGIVPTEEGERFYMECKQGLNILENAFQNFSPESALQKGSLKIGASTSIIKHVLMKAVKKFGKEYPNIKISFTEVIASRLERYLMNGDIDIAFMEEPIYNLAAYETKQIGSLTSCFVASNNFLKNELTKKEMEDFNYAVLKNNTNHRALFDNICLKNNLMLNVFYEMASFETLAEICESELAVGFVIEEFVKNELKLGKLKKIVTPINLPKSILFMLLPKTHSSGFICKKFLEFLETIK